SSIYYNFLSFTTLFRLMFTFYFVNYNLLVAVYRAKLFPYTTLFRSTNSSRTSEAALWPSTYISPLSNSTPCIRKDRISSKSLMRLSICLWKPSIDITHAYSIVIGSKHITLNATGGGFLTASKQFRHGATSKSRSNTASNSTKHKSPHLSGWRQIISLIT